MQGSLGSLVLQHVPLASVSREEERVSEISEQTLTSALTSPWGNFLLPWSITFVCPVWRIFLWQLVNVLDIGTIVYWLIYQIIIEKVISVMWGNFFLHFLQFITNHTNGLFRDCTKMIRVMRVAAVYVLIFFKSKESPSVIDFKLYFWLQIRLHNNRTDLSWYNLFHNELLDKVINK